MPLNVVADQEQIVAAINGFNDGYHNDYLVVRELSTTYLEAPTQANVALLASALSQVLSRWGAGKRKAPAVQSLDTVRATLVDPVLHALLVRFSALSIASLDIIGRANRVVDGENAVHFDIDLNAVLSQLSAGILVGNTNVTYPMKALLLITGFMPALDSQVRKGLGVAGFASTNVTQLVMPAGMNTNESKIVTRLPFYLAECYSLNGELLRGAALASHYDWLANETGRLFDILLFMQGSAEYPLLSLTPPIRGWQNIA